MESGVSINGKQKQADPRGTKQQWSDVKKKMSFLYYDKPPILFIKQNKGWDKGINKYSTHT